jgi:hypothetical protein
MLKKIVVLASAIFVFSACSQNKDERAREVVEHYCDLHFTKYLPFGFKKLEPAYLPYIETTQFAASQKSKLHLQQGKDSLTKSVTPNDSLSNSKIALIDKKISDINANVALQTKTFKGPQLGWSLYHTFTYKNSSNVIIKTNLIFILDVNFTKVIKTLAD